MIKKLKFPEIIERKLLGCVNYTRTTNMPANILLVGCPPKYISRILEAIANESGVNAKLVEDRFLKQGDIAAILTNLNSGDYVCFTHFNEWPPEITHIFKQSLSAFQLNVTLGKGSAARNIIIDLPTFNTIISVEKMSQVPEDMLEAFFEIIDFKNYDYELRLLFINDFAEKHFLSIHEDVKDKLAKQFVQFDQLNIQLIELRNQAYETGIKNITSEFLQGTPDTIPPFEIINAMDGREFELFTSTLFRALGYTNITVTQSCGDFGADVIAEKDDVRFSIQCKRYSMPVGITAVQEVIASRSLYDCHVACILTNNVFTPAAQELARKNLVILWDGSKLKEFIERAKQQC